MSNAQPLPTCPRCGAPMRLARKVPAAFGHPELRSFACTKCREAVTVEVRPETTANLGVGRVEIPSTFQ